MVIFKILDLAMLLFYWIALTRFCMFAVSKQSGRFIKVLWTIHNIWTLPMKISGFFKFWMNATFYDTFLIKSSIQMSSVKTFLVRNNISSTYSIEPRSLKHYLNKLSFLLSTKICKHFLKIRKFQSKLWCLQFCQKTMKKFP